MSVTRRLVGLSTLMFLLACAATTARAQSVDDLSFTLLPSSGETAPHSGEYNFNYDVQLVDPGLQAGLDILPGESFTIYNVGGYVSASTGTLSGSWSVSTSTPGVPPADLSSVVSIDPTATSVTFTYTGSTPIALATSNSGTTSLDLGDFTLVSTTNVVGIGQYTDSLDETTDLLEKGSGDASSKKVEPHKTHDSVTSLDFSNIPAGALFGTQLQVSTDDGGNVPLDNEGLIEAPYDPNVVADILSTASVPLPSAAYVFALAALAAAYSAKRFARGRKNGGLCLNVRPVR